MKLVVHLRFYSKVEDSLETLPPKKLTSRQFWRNYVKCLICKTDGENLSSYELRLHFPAVYNWSATSTEFLRGTQGQFATECVENTFLDYPEYFL